MEVIKVEWDENKRKTNLEKHGIDFPDIVKIFLDPNRIELISNRKDYEEIRYMTIGMVNEVILLVVYTERNDFKRII